jgi:N-terminal C2 in EEIG1 and EHBP1 proteins
VPQVGKIFVDRATLLGRVAMSPKLGVKTILRNPLLSTHRGKEPNKFQFDVVIDRVYGGSAADYAIKWCRGVKTTTTKPFTADPKTKNGVEVSQKLSLLCTLYRSKATAEGSGGFEAKDAKFSLLSFKGGKKSEKTVGKIHFDLSKFAAIPSATTQHTFQLNTKTKMDASITCTFVCTSRGTSGSNCSGVSGMTVSSGECEAGGNDDYADLDLHATAPNHDAFEDSDMTSPMSALGDMQEDFELTSAKRYQTVISSLASENSSFDQSERSSALGSDKTKSKTIKAPIFASSVSFVQSKAKISALEAELERHRHNCEDARKESEKARVVIQMSEDTIRELRETIEYSSGSASTKSNSQEKELQVAIDTLQRRVATSNIEMQKRSENYENRITTLKGQVDIMERTTERLVGEKETIRKQMSSLEEILHSESDSKDEVVRAREARDKLINEVSDLRETNQAVSFALKEERKRREDLEFNYRGADIEIKRLRSKLDAHEEHSKQIKSTFEELSKMYTALRSEHVRDHNELKAQTVAPTLSSGGDRMGLLLRKSEGDKEDRNEEVGVLMALHNQVRQLKAEVETKRRLAIESEREKLDAQKQAASIEGDVVAARTKAADARHEVSRQNERLERFKAKYLALSEQLKDALQVSQEYEMTMDKICRMHNDEVANMRVEYKDEVIRLREAASSGVSKSRDKHLEEALAEASEREDKYEQEILNMTSIVDGLSKKLTEASKAAAQSQEVRRLADEHASKTPGVSENASGLIQGAVEAATSCNAPAGNDPLYLLSALGSSNYDKKVGESKSSLSDGSCIEFTSSSDIRKANILEKITDGRLLNMLVEAKMKLAVAEEEKLALEYLIRRIRDGDKHIQAKLAQHASKLEVKLNQANQILASLHDDSAKSNDFAGESPRQHAVLRFFSPQKAKPPPSPSSQAVIRSAIFQHDDVEQNGYKIIGESDVGDDGDMGESKSESDSGLTGAQDEDENGESGDFSTESNHIDDGDSV